jgi:hypothetical protein
LGCSRRPLGQEGSLTTRKLPASERLLWVEAAIHESLLDDGRSAYPGARDLPDRQSKWSVAFSALRIAEIATMTKTGPSIFSKLIVADWNSPQTIVSCRCCRRGNG